MHALSKVLTKCIFAFIQCKNKKLVWLIAAATEEDETDQDAKLQGILNNYPNHYFPIFSTHLSVCKRILATPTIVLKSAFVRAHRLCCRSTIEIMVLNSGFSERNVLTVVL